MRQKITWIVGLVLALDCVLLILLGKNYTKSVLIDPFFYTHDVVILIMVFFCAPYFKFTKRIKSIELLFLMSIGYLAYSFFAQGFENVQIILRQFMIFGYGICFYIIMNFVFNNETIKTNFTRYLMYFGLLCVVVQVLYLPYLFFYLDTNPFFERKYFSPMIMMGLFVAVSSILVNIKHKLLKHFLFLFLFLLSFSTGHDSTYLSLALIYITYLFVISSKKYKIVLSASLVVGIVLIFVLIPSFTDVNVKWRLLYWQDSLWRIANNYFVLGDGFGIPYVTDGTIKELNALFADVPFSPQITEEKKYLSAPHNSFLTMAIHVGVFSVVFLFYPLISLFTDKSLFRDKKVLFLALSLLGMGVFSSFNVILELPHSSSLFWIVLFGLIFKLSEKNEALTNVSNV